MSSSRQRFVTGARWLDLLATVEGAYGPNPRERMPDEGSMYGWLAERALAPAAAVDAAEVEAAQRIRESLRHVVNRVRRGDAPDEDALDVLRSSMRPDQPPEIAASSDGLILAAPPTATIALAWLVREAVTDLTSEKAAQLGACADHDCGAVYLDPSGRRQWCSTRVCGNRHRVRRSRARREAAGREPVDG